MFAVLLLAELSAHSMDFRPNLFPTVPVGACSSTRGDRVENYTRDAAGHVIREDSLANDLRFVVDWTWSGDRVTQRDSWTVRGGRTERHSTWSYTYDLDGRVSIIDESGYRLRAGSRVLLDDDWMYDYDASGRLLREEGRRSDITFSWDGDRLATAAGAMDEAGRRGCFETLHYDRDGQLTSIDHDYGHDGTVDHLTTQSYEGGRLAREQEWMPLGTLKETTTWQYECPSRGARRP
jgi:hypothetical protein